MRFIPSQPDRPSPTWESAFGLFSFQVAAVLVSSLLIALLPDESRLGIFLSAVLTVTSAFLYARLAESQVPGALRQPGIRMRLAVRAALVTSVVALAPMVAFGLIQVNLSAFSRKDILIVAFLLWGLFIVPWLELWTGLTLAAWVEGRRSRS